MFLTDIANGTLIVNCAAIFILFGILTYLALIKKNDQFQDFLLIGAVSAVTLMATCIAFISVLEVSSISGASLVMGAETLNQLCAQLFAYLFGMFLLCQVGEEETVRKRWKQISVPFVVFCVLILGNLWGHYLFYVDSADNFYVTTYLYISLRLLPAIMFFYVLVKLWPTTKTLVVTYLILLMTRIYFAYALQDISCSSLFLSIAILYTLGCFRIRTILFQVGTIILLLFSLMALFVGNFVTVSAFSSFLSTISDAHSSEMYAVTEVMDRYEAMPWLMEYWQRNARRIKINRYADNERLYATLSKDNVRRVTVEEVERLSPELQYLFANECYIRIAEAYDAAMKDLSMNELFLIVPERADRALVIFDGRRNDDGSYRLGEMVDLRSLEKCWNNYSIASSQNYMNWTWLRFTEKDEFGFHLDYVYSDDREPAYLCDKIRSGEVYAQMSAAENFRRQVLVFFVVLVVVVLIILYIALVKPLIRMRRSLNSYRKDKDTEKLTDGLSGITVRNEIGMLAEEFSAMAQEMEHYTEEVAELAGKQERVNTELRMASLIQEAVLPSAFPAFPDRTEFDLYALMDPAKAVGGDFYDFFLVDDTHLAILIADVSDKGVPAALFMMSSKNLINYRAKQGGTPGEILSEINNQICSSSVTEMFVTVWMGILDTATGRMVCTNAGHEFPILRGEDGVFRIYKDPHSFVVGGYENVRYKDYELELKPGDAIFVYTDGVPEANNSAEEFYGVERLEKALNEVALAPPKEILKSVRKDVEEFVQDAEQFDDLTMLCLVYKGNGEQA